MSIGGGLATFVSELVDLSEAETLFVTMGGMGAGLAAFFGEPVGGALFACEVRPGGVPWGVCEGVPWGAIFRWCLKRPLE